MRTAHNRDSGLCVMSHNLLSLQIAQCSNIDSTIGTLYEGVFGSNVPIRGLYRVTLSSKYGFNSSPVSNVLRVSVPKPK